MPRDNDPRSTLSTFANVVDVLFGWSAITGLEMCSMAGVHDPVFQRVSSDPKLAEEMGKWLCHLLAPSPDVDRAAFPTNGSPRRPTWSSRPGQSCHVVWYVGPIGPTQLPRRCAATK